MDRRERGIRGERYAADFLADRGYDLLARNWRCRYGEIDLIATDQETVVFVEVKTRGGYDFGGPWEAVTPAKQNRIRRLASIWLAERQGSWVPVRFDVVGVMLEAGIPPSITHLEGVF